MTLDPCPSDAELRRIAESRRSLGRGPALDLIARLRPDLSPEGYEDQPPVKRPPKAKRRAGRALKAPIPTEHEEQKALIAWCHLHERQYPEMALLFAIPNGGHRHPSVAGKLKAEGVRAGVPDLCLPVSRGGYFALWLELKRVTGGRVSPVQRDWHGRLTRAGHRVVVCCGWKSARDAIVEYLNLSPTSEVHRP